MTLSVYFDETIFSDGFSLRRYPNVNVFNEADRYLADRLGKRVAYGCAAQNNNNNNDNGDDGSISSSSEFLMQSATGSNPPVVNLNPRIPCAGINLYTMDPLNKLPLLTVPFNRIGVIDVRLEDSDAKPPSAVVPVYVGEHVEGNVYTVNRNLGSFESALMIKYFAVNAPIFITKHLYNDIEHHFVDGGDRRQWFDTNALAHLANSVTQNHRGELVRSSDGEIVDVPFVDYHGPSI